MKCPRCEAQIPSEALFCDQCGCRLELVCGSCGTPQRVGAQFCQRCGQDLSETLRGSGKILPALARQCYIPKYLADKILAARDILEGERKQVTVLFADIKGSTELIERLDPEEAQLLIDPALQIMMDAVHRYEGTVSQILGDGILAFFGAPLSHEDHALRACYAALAMQEDMSRYAEGGGHPGVGGLKIRVGLNSGEVVFRSISNDLNIEYSGVGYTIHLAARMEELAPNGSIAMTAPTLKEIEGFVRARSLGAVQVKGVSRSVDMFELLGATGVRKRLDVAAMRGLTPFVGRKSETEIFEQLLEQAARGCSQILSMIGEPGVGKSRLVYELLHSHRNLPSRVLEAIAVSYGQAIPYFPLIALLKTYFDIERGDTPEAIQAKVLRCTLGLEATLMDAVPPLLALLDALPGETEDLPSSEMDSTSATVDVAAPIARFREFTPRERRESTLSGLKRILIHESHRQPLVLVFEDLHWIDNETQAFLDSFVESLPAARILLVVNYRPGYKQRWSNKAYYTHLRLDPLGANRAAELLEHLLGNDSGLGPLKDLLIERTEGNPFFLEESVRTLAETNVLIGEKGAYKVAHLGSVIRIPTTVQAVLADRIDRLPADAKHVLQTAAVIGMTVPVQLLRAVAEMPEEILRRAVDSLKAAELLYEPNLFPELEYTFKHALTNEVVYTSLLHDHRKTLHSRIVGVLEATKENSASEQVERLAGHALRGEVWDKAVIYMKEAGAKAMTRSANREAVVFFEQAVAALQHLPQSRETLELAVDLRLDLRNAVFLLGEIGRIPNYLDEAQKAAEILNDNHRLQRILNFRIAYFSMTGEPDRAIEIGEPALKSGFACHDPGAAVVTHYYMGIVYYTTGNYREAMRVLSEAMRTVDEDDLKFERFGTSTIVSAICRTWMVQSLAQTGAFDPAIARGKEGVEIAEQARHPYSLGYVNCSQGFLYLLKGDLDAAVEKLERSLKLCREANIRVLFPQIASYLGFAYALSGRTTEALPLMEAAEEQTMSIGRLGGQSLRLAWQGETYLLSGRTKEAVALADRAYDLSQKHKERGHHAWTLRLKAEIAARGAAGTFAAAESLYRNSLELSWELGMAPLSAHCHLGLGLLFLHTGVLPKSRIELSRAFELYRDMKMTLWLARAASALQNAGGTGPVGSRNAIKIS